MTWLLGIVQFIILTCIFLYELKNKSPIVFMWATLFVMFGVMHLIASFTGDIDYSDVILCQASVFVIFFCLIYLFTRIALISGLKLRAIRKLTISYAQNELRNAKNLAFLLLVFVGAVVIKVYLYVQSVGGFSQTSWFVLRAYHASLSYVNYSQLLSVIYYSLAGVIVVFWVKKKYSGAALAMICILLDVLIMRARIEILPFCSAIITIYFLYMKRISIRTLVLIVVGGSIVIFLVYGLRAMRHYGTLQDLVENFTFSAFRSSINSSLINNKGELGLRRWFYYFISEDNEFDGFGKCATYIRMLLVFLPTRWSFGLKPDDFALTMGAAIGMAPGGSMHPTLFGDCYANLGMLGVSLGAFWAILASLADKLIFSRKNYVSMILLYVLWGAELCIIGRGAVYNGFVYIAYGSVFILFTDFIVLKTRIPQISVVISAKKR